jgi:succinoglycan biosynthesis transport protein ExoP
MRPRQELIPTDPSRTRLLQPVSPTVDPLPPEEDASWLRDALRIVSERRRIVIGVIGVAALILTSYATLMPATHVFEARAQMLVEPESSSPLDYGRPAPTVDPEGSYYETQYRILRSRALARRTLASLAVPTPDGKAAPATKAADAKAAPGAKSAPDAKASDAKAPPAKDANGNIAIDAIPSSAVDAFLRSLSISHIANSRLVEVRVQSSDPAYAARAANAHAQAYIRQSVEMTLLASRQTETWLRGEIEDERARLEKGTAALDKVRQKEGSIEEKQTMIAQRLSELNASVLRARAQRVARETAYQQIVDAQKAGRSTRDLAALLSSPLVQQLSADLATQQRRDVELAATYGERHPERIKAKEAIAFAENRLDTEVNRAIDVMRSDVAAARQDEARLAGALDQQTAESSNLGRKAVDYESLKRDVANDRTLFEKLQQRARELQVSSDYELSNIRVIDPAEVPHSPLPDARWRNVGLGAAGSVFFAFVLVFGLHYLDERLRSPEDIETHLGLPYLGMVPRVQPRALEKGSSGVGIVKRIDLPLPFKEAMRDLRTHVLCTPAGRAAKILLVTSTATEEGKTLVATNLATGLSQVGNRVLLIDLDLRQPSVHRAFDLPLQPGLSELLSGSASRARDPIRPTEVRGLWVLTAGRPLVNPGDLIGSSAFRQLIQSFTKTFDRIVIDSPPVMAVTDASLIATEDVGVVFVVSADRTARRPAQAALDRLEAVGARFIGVVLNRVDLRNDSPYYMHYEGKYGVDAGYDENAPPPTSPAAAPAPPPSPIDTATVQPPSPTSSAAAAGGTTEPRV